MIRITIELIPRGDVTQKQHLGTADIINDGTGTRELGNYTVRLSKWGRPNTIWKMSRVTGFRRLKFGPWDLLFLALAATVGKRMFKRARD